MFDIARNQIVGFGSCSTFKKNIIIGVYAGIYRSFWFNPKSFLELLLEYWLSRSRFV
jgi:hypothetical protein